MRGSLVRVNGAAGASRRKKRQRQGQNGEVDIAKNKIRVEHHGRGNPRVIYQRMSSRNMQINSGLL